MHDCKGEYELTASNYSIQGDQRGTVLHGMGGFAMSIFLGAVKIRSPRHEYFFAIWSQTTLYLKPSSWSATKTMDIP